MTEIDKMYENAGFIKKQCKDYSCTVCEQYNDCKKYPLFTAEKQIELIKLLTQRCDLTISHFTKWEFIHYDGQEPTQVTGKDFAETFAKLVNAYWQDLTDQDKEEIRRILNE